jgi:Domain of unknown function (DUF4912)
MDDLKKLSVERLRELARKHLGKGHSRLRTKAQLLEALKAALREPLARLRDAAEAVMPHVRDKVRVVDFPPGRKGRVRSERTPPAGVPSQATSGSGAPRSAHEARPSSGKRGGEGAPGERPAAAASGRGKGTSAAPAAPAPHSESSPPATGSQGARPRSARAVRASRPSSNGAPSAAAARTARDVTPPIPLRAAEAPVEEGFFETPTTPRRSRRAPSASEPFEPGPFASPREVGTDAPVLLVRDPTTLFVFWDFRRELERGAALGLREPRLLLRLHRGADLDRTLELPLSSRSTYVTGLTSGQEYTAEVLLLGRDGWTRPVGARSAGRRLPPGRVSAQLEVRTLRLPWSEPLSGAPAPSAPSAPRDEPLDSPRRVSLPTSPGARGAKDGSGQSGGPRSGRN